MKSVLIIFVTYFFVIKEVRSLRKWNCRFTSKLVINTRQPIRNAECIVVITVQNYTKIKAFVKFKRAVPTVARILQ